MAKTKKLGDLVNQTVTLSAPLSGTANLTDTLNFSITKANTTTDGYVSKEDWNIFNNKQDALGFTPYNATNPDGYISGITSGMVTTALGFTPYDSANPSGYITSSALTPYAPISNPNFTTAITTPIVNGVSGLLSFGSTDRVNIGNYATPSAQRMLTVGQDTAWVTIGSVPGATSQGGLWINQATPSSSNAIIVSTASVTIIGSIGSLYLKAGGVNVTLFRPNNLAFNPIAVDFGTAENFTFTKPNNTGQTASTSIAGFNYNGGSRQWATGAISTQSENVWGATTYSFVGASTITNAYGNVFNAPIAGLNCIITNNFSARFNGQLYLTQTVTTETVVQTRTVTIVINGTTYKLLAA